MVEEAPAPGLDAAPGGVAEAAPAVVFRPHPGVQTALCELPAPIDDALMGGGRFGGKTYGVAFDWLKHAKQYGPLARGLAFRKSYDELDEIQKIFRRLFKPLGAAWHAGRRTWLFPGGAELKLRYLKDAKAAENYQGHSYTFIYVDEMGNYDDPQPIDDIQATLRSGDAPGIRKLFRATANPGGRGHDWIKARYITPAPGGWRPFYDEDARTWRVYLPSTMKDNPSAANDPEALDKIYRATKGRPHLRKAWIDGDWDASVEGEVFLGEWYFPDMYWRVLPGGRREVVISADLTFKNTAGSDRVAIQAWARYVERPAERYLLGLDVDQMTLLESAARLVAMAGKFPDFSRILIENKANGPAILETLASRVPKMLEFNPEGSKRERATVSAAYYEAGNIRLPDPMTEDGRRVHDFVQEHLHFTGKKGGVDDQIDAESQAMIDFERRPLPAAPAVVTFPGRMSRTRRRR